ncbi:unnamed protein product [Lampetra fluviatilis]
MKCRSTGHSSTALAGNNNNNCLEKQSSTCKTGLSPTATKIPSLHPPHRSLNGVDSAQNSASSRADYTTSRPILLRAIIPTACPHTRHPARRSAAFRSSQPGARTRESLHRTIGERAGPGRPATRPAHDSVNRHGR